MHKLKFIFSKKAKKLTKSSTPIWWLLHTVKLAVKILSIFVAFSENMNFTFTRVFFIFYPFMASMFLRAKPPKTIRMHLCRDFNLLYVMLLNIRIPIPFFLAVRKYFILFGKAYQNLQQQFQWTKVICLKNRWFPKKYKIKSFSYLSSL